jgi:hypothetical protein
MLALASLAATQGRPDIVKNWLERATQAKPEALEPALRLVQFYARSNDSAKALMLGQKAVDQLSLACAAADAGGKLAVPQRPDGSCPG